MQPRHVASVFLAPSRTRLRDLVVLHARLVQSGAQVRVQLNRVLCVLLGLSQIHWGSREQPGVFRVLLGATVSVLICRVRLAMPHQLQILCRAVAVPPVLAARLANTALNRQWLVKIVQLAGLVQPHAWISC